MLKSHIIIQYYYYKNKNIMFFTKKKELFTFIYIYQTSKKKII